MDENGGRGMGAVSRELRKAIEHDAKKYIKIHSTIIRLLNDVRLGPLKTVFTASQDFPGFFHLQEEDALAAMKRRDEDIEKQLSEAIIRNKRLML